MYIYICTCNGPTASDRALFLRNICQTKKNDTCQSPQSNKCPSQPVLEHANGPWQQEIPFNPEVGPNDMAGNILSLDATVQISTVILTACFATQRDLGVSPHRTDIYMRVFIY